MSQRESSEQDDFHSMDSDEELARRLPRSVWVTEPVLDDSANPLATPDDSRVDMDARREEARKAASAARFALSNEERRRPASSLQRPMTSTSAGSSSFKPASLPKFDRKSNVSMFLKLYRNSMYGADSAMMDSAIINCLDSETQTIILPRLPENGWTFANVSKALIEEFGSHEALLGRKMDFADTKLRAGETLEDFTSRFYLEAQTLASLKAVSFIDVQSALLNALRVNRELSLSMKSGIYAARTVPDLIRLLRTYKEDFEIPVPESRPKPRAPQSETPRQAERPSSTPTGSSPRLCFKCSKPGHLSRDCKSPRKVLMVGAEQEEEDEAEAAESEEFEEEEAKNY